MKKVLFSVGLALATSPLFAQTGITLALTNGSLFAGQLTGQSRSNLTVSVGGETMVFARAEIRWLKFREPAKTATAPARRAPESPNAVNNSTTNSLALEFTRPHSEDEMRTLLRTPEGQALLKKIHDQFIGSDPDPRAGDASKSYYRTMQDFSDGRIGFSELRDNAQDMLGKLDNYSKEMNEDAQASRWREFQRVLQQFAGQSKP